MNPMLAVPIAIAASGAVNALVALLTGSRHDRLARHQMLLQRELAAEQQAFTEQLQDVAAGRQAALADRQHRNALDQLDHSHGLNLHTQHLAAWYQALITRGAMPWVPGRWEVTRGVAHRSPVVVIDVGTQESANHLVFGMRSLAVRLRQAVGGRAADLAQVIEDRLGLETEGDARTFLQYELRRRPAIVVYARRDAGSWGVDACFSGVIPDQVQIVEGGGLAGLVARPEQAQWVNLCHFPPGIMRQLADATRASEVDRDRLFEASQAVCDVLVGTQVFALVDQANAVRRTSYAPFAPRYLDDCRAALAASGCWTLPAVAAARNAVRKQAEGLEAWAAAEQVRLIASAS